MKQNFIAVSNIPKWKLLYRSVSQMLAHGSSPGSADPQGLAWMSIYTTYIVRRIESSGKHCAREIHASPRESLYITHKGIFLCTQS